MPSLFDIGTLQLISNQFRLIVGGWYQQQWRYSICFDLGHWIVHYVYSLGDLAPFSWHFVALIEVKDEDLAVDQDLLVDYSFTMYI